MPIKLTNIYLKLILKNQPFFSSHLYFETALQCKTLYIIWKKIKNRALHLEIANCVMFFYFLNFCQKTTTFVFTLHIFTNINIFLI